mgnify:CR=1 FL=1
MVVSRRPNTCLWEAINIHVQNGELFGAQPTQLLPEALRRLSESRQLLGQVSRAQMEIPSSRILKTKMLGVGQTTFSALAISKCFKSGHFARPRRQFIKRVHFVIALVICRRRSRPGIAQTKAHLAAERRNIFLVSEVNLARGGF